MSHHFDTPTVLRDPRVNLCDMYLFQGSAGHTVMAMTVNPDAGLSSPETFHAEGLYAFRFDINNDLHEEVTFKIQFGSVRHADGDEHKHVQTVTLSRATGQDARRGAAGELIAKGHTGEIVQAGSGLRLYAGLAPDLFAGDAAALTVFRNALFKDNKFDPEAFRNRENFFARRNVTAIVLELPSRSIGRGMVRAWATASMYGHAPEMQVSRWGLPLVTNLFMPEADMKERFNRSTPADDQSPFIAQVGLVAEKITTLSGSAANPSEYAKQMVGRLFPTMLPYELDTPAAFDFAGFNGRALTDDVMDVILTLASNAALEDGVAPDKSRTRDIFPYFGDPFTATDQQDVSPARPAAQNKW
ncbi:DUF4331 family protein [Rhodopila sp.]|uniref:DUF4331 family protein n=1 Tax=Rhodopila sp. TaxID=2480087 RepID=UPI003D135BA4